MRQSVETTGAVTVALEPGQGDTHQSYYGAAAGSGVASATPAPSAQDVRAFHQAMEELSTSQVSAVTRTTHDPDPLRLGALSDYLHKRTERMAALADYKVRKRDAESMVKVSIQMAESGLENQMLGKVIGKTVSGIEALTKLS